MSCIHIDIPTQIFIYYYVGMYVHICIHNSNFNVLFHMDPVPTCLVLSADQYQKLFAKALTACELEIPDLNI